MRRSTAPLAVLVGAIAATAAGCSSSHKSAKTLTLHVGGPVARTSRPPCVFVIRAAVDEGGSQRTCLTAIDGFPSPRATMHSTGLMTFALARGTVVVRVRIAQRFAGDGRHARQTVEGEVVRGTGEYARARGSLSGGGAVVDTPAALRILRLAYRLRIVR